MAEQHTRGAEGEALAADYLRAIGYTLVTRRYRCPEGEIDLVALDGETLVFVEVKSYRAHPSEGLTSRKLECLTRTAARYMSETGSEHRETRYDAVLIDDSGLHHERDWLRV